ncbi:hypothetical protein L249_8160 [Ophiocordyceps polyrhachis-furcata BCC 54312]|uniref:FAD-binding FR-type domain-containing protein n=1 Tax=Ophiocordyceps polyrhachis-furcata BCC 54312 TaxID=1330021 RepID=A0A367LHQ4_9HYPO|nr:hypothetical protein L249_8160 [Ophiocordyceps polyrhachis-furcata BCC 54312]
MSSLKQFIRNVRAAKTIADERAVIQKESAAIRASFREESADHGVRDLSHSNQYIVGLALCTLGNIASVEMSRDLFPEIEQLISTSNPYIRRKAALCAMRICRKVPDLQENFLEKAAHLLADRNHGVLLCGLTLVTSLCEADEDEEGGDNEEATIEKFRTFVPGLVKTLKSLSTSGYAPEHDVTGITDPFLQVKILRLLRVLAVGDAETSEQINDILAQVATNTDSSKNVGNSILYEAVRTILDIEADSGLRVLGVNILGKFLTNRDNNIRYVALNTLIKVVAIEPNAVQRHRNTILECLRDPDISIRRRALELSFTLINESNVRVLIRELLAFLEVADNEFKPTMTSQIGIASDKFAPSKRWHFDTMLRVLSLAGNYLKEQILSSFIRLLATTPELQPYAVQKLYANLKMDITQESLTQAAAWCVGEYADMLLRGGQYEEEVIQPVKESEVVDLLALILNSSYATQVTTEYIVTALMKLTTRFSDASQVERIRRILQNHQTSLDVEVQQRAVEYGNLFSFDEIRRGVLEKMPPPQIKEESRVLGPAPTKKNKGANRKSRVVKPTEQDLLDLMDAPPAAAAPANGSQASNSDLLADILGGGAAAPSPVSSTTSSQQQQPATSSSIMDLFGSEPSPAVSRSSAALDLMGDSAPPSKSGPAGHACYEANGLQVTLQLQRNAEGAIQATAVFQNRAGSAPLSNVGLQAAVPKSQKLQLLSISSSEVAVGGSATQMMRISGCKGVLRLRLRIGYTHPTAGTVMDQEFHEGIVIRVDQVNERIRLFRLELRSGPAKFLPGQWVDAFVPGVAQPGGFTITSVPSRASTPTKPYLELAVAQADGNAVAEWLWRPRQEVVGDELRLRIGGSFVFPPLDERLAVKDGHGRGSGMRSLVFVAGGVGINPLFSMLGYVAESGLDVDDVRLLYATKLPRSGRLEDVLFLRDIAALFGQRKLRGSIRLYVTATATATGATTAAEAGATTQMDTRHICGASVSVRPGRISAEQVRSVVRRHDPNETLVYICGPPLMTDELVAALTAEEDVLDSKRILTEKWW